MTFYDRQSDGASDYFNERIFDDIDALEDMAGIREIHLAIHRKIASRHPYLVYYHVVPTGAEVVAVLDGRGLPAELEVILRRR